MYLLLVGQRYPSERYPLNGIFEADQAKALVAVGNRVIYVGIDLQSVRVRRRWGFTHFKKDGIDIYEISIPIGAKGGENFVNAVGRFAFKSLYNRIEKEQGRPEIVHAHFFKHAIYANALCHKKGIPFIITEHSSIIGQGSLNQRLIMPVTLAYSRAARIIAVSQSLQKSIHETFGEYSIVIPNIVDMNVFSYSPGKKISTDEKKCFRFVSVGNLVKSKGFDLLLHAFSKLRMDYSSCTLTIYGDGPEREALLQICAKLHLENAVAFALQQTRAAIAEDYRSADAFVLASRNETFGVVYIEAMASGLPVIATRCGGPEDFVTSENGVLIPTEDIDELYVAMRHMVEYRDLYNCRGISEYARENFSQKSIVKRVTAIYAQVLSESKNHVRTEKRR